MYSAIKDQLQHELDEIRSAGLFKTERHIDSPQANHIKAGQIGESSADVLNFCANNYLGLADHPDIITAAKDAMDARGFGMASVRFICGTQDLHLALEQRVSAFLGTEDTILFSSCFDANGGVFESLFGAGGRHHLRRAEPRLHHRRHPALQGPALPLRQPGHGGPRDATDRGHHAGEPGPPQDHRHRRRLLDGRLPRPARGDLRPRREVRRHGHGGRLPRGGLHGRHRAGTPEHAGVSDRVDIYTGTFGKALGGASGGYVSGRREVIAMLRQKARPYLFSNSLAPAIVAATLKALDLVESSGELRSKLFANAELFRNRMSEEGFELLPGEHAIVPVMFGDAVMAAKVADAMLHHGVFVTAFSYPVVPKGAARIRVQLSAAHSAEDVEACVAAFVQSRAAVAA